MATITIEIDTEREEDVRDLADTVEAVARLVTFQTVVRSSMHAPVSADVAAEEAAARVLRDNQIERVEGEDPLAALGWAMGDEIEYEEALKQFAHHVIKRA